MPALLSLVAGCGEAAATRGTGPPSEMAFAPRVERSAGPPALQLAGPLVSPPAPSASAASPTGADASDVVGHLEGTHRLGHLFQALAGLDEGRAHDDVHVLQYGDSHTASDLGTAVLRRLLQARFGDGGRGFVSIGKPWKTYVQDGVRGGMTKDFWPQTMSFHKGQFSGDGCYGLLGVGIGAASAGARAWTEIAPRSSRVELDYWQQPRGGSFDVFIDGNRAGRIVTRAPQAGSGFSAFDVPDAPHEVELRAIGDGEVRAFGMALDRAQAGVVVDALGINGAQIFTPLHWSEEHFAEQLRHRAPDLVVLAYGTNEALEIGLGDAEYERSLVDLLGRVARAAPSASCLLLGPPDLGRITNGRGPWHPWPRVVEIVAAQRRVAQAAGCAFYDQLEAMGGPGTILAWASEPEPRAQRDRVHFTRTGYAQLGTSFETDLVRAYDGWRAQQGLPPASAPKSWGVASR